MLADVRGRHLPVTSLTRMHLLVTGGAGFVGSTFVRALLGGGYPALDADAVTVLDKLTYAGDPANLAPVLDDPRLRLVIGDIADAGTVDPLVRQADVLLHLAAESHVDRSIREADDFVRTNVLGTSVLLAAAARHGLQRFVHVSTDEVYGSIETGSCAESAPLAPSSPYAASKAGSDLLALAYHRTHGVPVSITRSANNFGPYQLPEKIVPLFLTRLLRGLPVPLYGDGHQVREWLPVAEHCRALALVAAGGRPGEIYNVAGALSLTNRSLTDRLLAEVGADRSLVEEVADRPGHDRRYSLSGVKIAEELGFVPAENAEQALRETARWYRDHEAWWSRLIDRAALG